MEYVSIFLTGITYSTIHRHVYSVFNAILCTADIKLIIGSDKVTSFFCFLSSQLNINFWRFVTA